MKQLKKDIFNLLDIKDVSIRIPKDNLYILELIRTATNIAVYQEHLSELNLFLSYLNPDSSGKYNIDDIRDACMRIGVETPILAPSTPPEPTSKKQLPKIPDTGTRQKSSSPKKSSSQPPPNPLKK